MNSLNGNVISGAVDTGEGTPNGVPLNTAQWHEYWITIGAGGTGTHQVTVYLDGSLIAAGTFDVTAGNGSDFSTTYLAIGVGSTPWSGAVDIDFVRVALAEHVPSPPSTPTNTPTPTPTVTPTPTSIPQGGNCEANPSNCDVGLLCVDGVCCDSACDGPNEVCNLGALAGVCTEVAPAPTTSRTGLLISLGALLLVGALALAQLRRALGAM